MTATPESPDSHTTSPFDDFGKCPPDFSGVMTQQRPITDEQKLAALELLELAMGTPREVADVWVSFQPHTQGIEVRITNGGWHAQNNPGNHFERTSYLDDGKDNEFRPGINRVLDEVKAHLASLPR